jgi:hypothetical protein
MAESFCPLLSEAQTLFPLLRARLAAAARRCSLPANLSLGLLPIVEDGVFGYEILPSVETPTYLTIGRDARGTPLLRRSTYCAQCPCTLRLAAANGCVLRSKGRETRRHIERDNATFADWTAATEAVWAELTVLFPEGPRGAIEIQDGLHRRLDDALATARAQLAPRDPCIDFCGVPDEAQYGFALTGTGGACGLLTLQPQGWWVLRWESPADPLHRRWPASPADGDAAGAWARAGLASSGAAPPRTLPAMAASRAIPQPPS